MPDRPKSMRLASLNHYVAIGRVTSDTEVRSTPSGKTVANMRVAIPNRFKGKDGTWQDNPAFLSVTLWGPLAERAKDKALKGKPVMIEGRLETNQFESKEGKKTTVINVIASRVQYLESQTSPTQGASEPEEDVP